MRYHDSGSGGLFRIGRACRLAHCGSGTAAHACRIFKDYLVGINSVAVKICVIIGGIFLREAAECYSVAGNPQLSRADGSIPCELQLACLAVCHLEAGDRADVRRYALDTCFCCCIRRSLQL